MNMGLISANSRILRKLGIKMLDERRKTWDVGLWEVLWLYAEKEKAILTAVDAYFKLLKVKNRMSF